MSALDELRDLFVQFMARWEPARPVTRGLLGDGLGNLWVGDSDQRVWFRKNGQDSQLVKVHCWRARPVDGVPVICGYTAEQPNYFQVLSWDRDKMEGAWAGMSGVARHAETHIWEDTYGGDDPVMVWTRAMMPFRVSPQDPADLTVQVEGPETFLWGASWKVWPGVAILNLAGCSPAADEHRYVLVYIDGTTAAGTANTRCDIAAKNVAVALTTADWPAPGSGEIPLALVYLPGAAGTTITEEDIVDARALVSVGGGSLMPMVHDHTTVAQGDTAKGEVLDWIGW